MKHMKIVSGTVLTMALSLALIAVATGTITSIIALQAAESGALVIETQLVLPR